VSIEVDLRVTLAVLGRVRVRDRRGDALAEPTGGLAKALLVSLALAGTDGVSAGRLVDEVWGDAPPGSPKSALQTLVSRVRQTSAPGTIDSTPQGYRLGGTVTTDLDEARRLLARARSAPQPDDPAIRDACDRALALWRGVPGDDLPAGGLAEELAAEASRLEGRLLRVRAEARLAGGDADGALDDLARLTAADAGADPAGAATPGIVADDLLALRLRALDRAGRRAEALRRFAEHREALADELGIDPSPRILALHTELLRDEAPIAPPSPPAVAGSPVAGSPVASASRVSAQGRVAGLRRSPNELLGREADVAGVVSALDDSRLVTILGPGGLGKTRLAHDVGWRIHDRDGELTVAVVELGSIRNADDVAAAIAAPLGIRDATVARVPRGEPVVRVDLRERILGALADGPTLLIVDNCEHLVDAAAAWVADILASTEGVRVVATSRAPLAIAAEQVHPLAPLPAAGAAARLFEDRARQARPGASLPRDVVERLCTRLDGLPLAIELAAARVRSMPVDEIERRLGNRFALLTTGDRSAPERHRTLTAVIDWSWNLLGPSEQSLLRRLAPLPGGFSADLAGHVARCGDAATVDGGTLVDDDLDGLVAQSLVSVVDDPRTGGVRYRMLETVREFGLARLAESGEAARVRGALHGWALDFARSSLARLDGTDQVAVIAAVTAEQDNLISVLRHAVDDDRHDVVVVVFACLGYHWTLRGTHQEVAEFGRIAVRALRRERPSAENRDAALLGLALAGSLTFFGDRRAGLTALGALRRLRRDGPARDPFVEMTSRLFVAATTDVIALESVLDEGLRSPVSAVVEVSSLVSAQLHENDGDVERSMALSVRGHDLAVQSHHVWSEATAAGQIAELHMQRGRPREALEWSARSQDGLAEVGATADVQRAEWLSALALTQLGRLDEARAVFQRFAAGDDDAAAADVSDGEDLTMVSRAGLAEIALAEGRPADAVTLYDDAAEALRRGDAFSPWRELVGAAALAARVTTGRGSEAATDRLARRLRVRLLAGERVPGMFRDVPILGSCVVALGLWLRRAGADPAADELGLRLMAFGRRVGGRQDLGVLLQAPHLDALSPADRATVERLTAEAAALDPREALSQAIALLDLRSIPRSSQ
jgi:predicted ATPase/DNA-binding SARP family transcriptional activator